MQWRDGTIVLRGMGVTPLNFFMGRENATVSRGMGVCLWRRDYATVSGRWEWVLLICLFVLEGIMKVFLGE